MYWQHVSGTYISPKYDSPEPLQQHSDQYFEDYCIQRSEVMCLKTVGIRSCEPNYRLINKYQNRHVLHWILSGEGWCNGVPFREGDAIYFKNHLPYTFSSNPNNPCVFAWITFEGESFSKYLKHMGLIGKFQIFRITHQKEIYAALYDLLYTTHCNVDIHLHFEASLFHLLSLSIPSQTEERLQIPKTEDAHLQTALNYISGHYNDPNFRVKQVSDQIGISEKWFRYLFKNALGVSVKDYVIKLRIDAAVTMLRSSNYNINEIAELVGYTDYRQFSEIFKNRCGCSPKQYKNKNLT